MPTLRMDAKLHNNSLTCGMQIVVFPKEVGGVFNNRCHGHECQPYARGSKQPAQ